MLFSSLRKDFSSDSADENAERQFPSVVQMYSRKYIDFEAALGLRKKSGHGSKAKYPYASLTFQSVSELGQGPTLGVWDCRVGPSERTSLLLKQVTENTSTIILALDLEKPNTVHSDLLQMLELLVNYFSWKSSVETDQNHEVPNCGPCCTTSIQMLASAKEMFGKIPGEENGLNASQSFPDKKISLVICGILPTLPDNDGSPVQSYAEKQAHNLVHYHLHKFASVAKCALLFTTLDENSILDPSNYVRMNENEPKEKLEASLDTYNKKTNEVKGLLDYLHVSAMGKEIPESSPSPNFHLPNSHDDHVISEVMLRNASCEGQWDANKDSLEKALPSISPNTTKQSQNKWNEMETEDEWLATLSLKMGKTVVANGSTITESSSLTQTSNSSTSQLKGKGKPRIKANKKEPEKTKDVSDFFANLMTKKK